MNKVIAGLKRNSFLGTPRSGWGGDEILRRIINATLLGLLVIVIYAACFTPLQFLRVASTGLLLAGASFISGAFLGFLFGIPRTNQVEEERVDINDAKGRYIRNNYKPNTNLEQISDWLTKILVGVGLTQLPKIIAYFNRMVHFFSNYLGNNPGIVASIIIYFLVFGFMLGFLWSRLYMAGAIRRAEAEAEAQALEERIVKKVQSKFEQQGEADARALSLVNQQLDPSADPVSQESLNEALAKASPAVRVTIFDQAQSFRQVNWNAANGGEKIARVVPVFRALIACDSDQRYHRNFAQLGYALKDQDMPNYEEAEENLSRAIQLRDKSGLGSKWSLYEFNRAFCRIKINTKQQKEIFSKEAIVQDLRRASQSSRLSELINSLPDFNTWMRVNAVSIMSPSP